MLWKNTLLTIYDNLKKLLFDKDDNLTIWSEILTYVTISEKVIKKTIRLYNEIELS